MILQAQDQKLASQADITSFAQSEEKMHIAVLPFVNRGKTSFDKDTPWGIVAGDFDFSNRFKIFKKKSFDSTDFALANIPVYIQGDYTIESDNARIAFQLFDVASQKMIYGKEYTVALKDLRTVAHAFANEIFQQLFGLSGGFETQLLFVRKTIEGKNIYLSDFDGKRARALTKSGINIMPTFDSDNNYLYVSFLRGKPDIYRSSLYNSTQNILLYSRRVESSPDVNPQNGSILYASSRNGNMDIYSAKSDGSGKTQLTVSWAIDVAPAWSPSGYYVAFISDKSGTPQVYVMDKYGGMMKRITFSGRYHDSPVWSPDGKQIAFTMIADGQYRIGVVNFNGTEERVLTASEGGSHRYPAWSPTGTHIAYTRSGGGYSDIFAVTVDDGRSRRITNFGNAETVSWSPFREITE